ncbi:MAG: pyridoxal phosphate-dependent aminotransferase [candidate division Zixibacteria bacterium]|nr:pyridoxal phosphate-dependent aminotransferase [candidate division Zixibacteria bacterium]
MAYDFDRRIPRNGTGSLKWDFISLPGERCFWDETDPSKHARPVLPLWVADMDFPAPQEVVEAVTERARQGIYGYAIPTDAYYDAVISWMARRQGWQIEREWICLTAGVVPALHMLVSTYVKPGEKVLIQPPVYYPFYRAIENNDAVVVLNPLIYENGRYRMDFDDLARKCADPAVKMAILCSPHNPVGRVWTRDELRRFGEICLTHDVLVVSDEVHGDLIFGDVSFTPYASLGGAFSDRAVVCTAPSKTFNLAGLQSSNLIIPHPELRAVYRKTLQRNGFYTLNAFGLLAAETAYRHGEAWLTQVLAYIEENYHCLTAFLSTHLPMLKPVPLEGTYLAWIDCRALGLDADALERLMLEEARVYLDEGYIFGPEGEGFERINLACPRSLLIEALERIKTAVDALKR